MARILFSLFSNINWLADSTIDPFYEGFINSLIEHGNEVLLIRTNGFLSTTYDNTLFNHISEKKLKLTALQFNPDLIIAANNHIPQALLNSLECPILLWSSDSPSWYSDIDYIKKNIDRYKFFHHGYNDAHLKICQEMFNAKISQNFSIGHVSSLVTKDLPIKNNIVYIGTVGYPHHLIDYLKYNCKNNSEFKRLHDYYLKVAKSPFDNLKERFNTSLGLNDFLHTITANNRIKTLDSISDLGLKVYGYPSNFFDVTPYSMDLAFCFDYTPITSMVETEYILNASKIGINLFNAQAISGFSWRVADIMASNACLISPNKPDLAKLSPYIKMPTFDSPQEARELCQKLLKDEIWRKDVVVASQKAIEEHGRFKHKFKIIEEAFNVRLFNDSSKEQNGKLITLRASNYIKTIYKPIYVVSIKIGSSGFLKKWIKKIIILSLKFIPKTFLKKIYHFLLSVKNEAL